MLAAWLAVVRALRAMMCATGSEQSQSQCR